MRPNIRIEIQNNLAEESMEVDENEEGEISDKDEPDIPLPTQPPPQEAQEAKAAFTTGINILDKKEQEKLQERARRFQLNPNDIKNFTEDDVKLLYLSLGITSDSPNVNFEVIHLRGIEQMSASDLLEYFLEYAPVSVEWINEETCNVVWTDQLSTARALHYLSKPVRGMPVRDDSSYFDSLNEESEDTSILLKNREIEIQEEPGVEKLTESNSVDISEITAKIPPGYWRLGNKHPNSKCLLLRFGLKTDQKPFKTEQFSRYSKLQKKNPKLQGIFSRNKELNKNEGNPWTALAENWDEDVQFREPERKQSEPEVEIKNPILKVRLGSKRKEEDPVEEEAPKKTKIPRMRMYADEEEEKIKRKKMLSRLNQQIDKIENRPKSDLREILSASKPKAVEVKPPEPEVFDLGSTLKNRNKKMVFEVKTGSKEPPKESHSHSHRRKGRGVYRRYSSEDDSFHYGRHNKNKPQSKVAVVIKKQNRPTVASVVSSTKLYMDQNQSEESDESSSESSSSSTTEEEEVRIPVKKPAQRPGFGSHLGEAHGNHKSPLKIEINNDHFRRN